MYSVLRHSCLWSPTICHWNQYSDTNALNVMTFVFTVNIQFGSHLKEYTYSLLLSVRWEDWYHCLICMVNTMLEPAACYLRLAQRLETRGNIIITAYAIRQRYRFTFCETFLSNSIRSLSGPLLLSHTTRPTTNLNHKAVKKHPRCNAQTKTSNHSRLPLHNNNKYTAKKWFDSPN